MSSSNLPPPPERPPVGYDREESPPIVEEGVEEPYVGVELFVSGLPHATIYSASHHLQEMLRELEPTHPITRYFVVRLADSRHACDYAYIALDPALARHPRPDLLEQLRGILDNIPGIHATWRVATGPDRTRRVVFPMDNKDQATRMLDRVREWLTDRGHEYQLSYASCPSGAWRLTFDLLDSEVVQSLLINPPVIDRHALTVSRPRFITPIYGLEVAVMGLQDLQGVRARIDRFIYQRYGQGALICSRMAMNGDVYTAVLRDWEVTSHFTSDPFDLFTDHPLSRIVSASRPLLLFLLNTYGVPANAAVIQGQALSSADSRNHQAQLDALRQQGTEAVRMYNEMFQRQQRMLDTLAVNSNQIMSTLTSIATTSSLNCRLIGAQSTLSGLRERHDLMQDVLVFTPEQTRPVLAQRIQGIEHRIDEEKETVAKIQLSLEKHEAHTFSLLPPGDTSAPGPLPLGPPRSQSPPPRALSPSAPPSVPIPATAPTPPVSSASFPLSLPTQQMPPSRLPTDLPHKRPFPDDDDYLNPPSRRQHDDDDRMDELVRSPQCMYTSCGSLTPPRSEETDRSQSSVSLSLQSPHLRQKPRSAQVECTSISSSCLSFNDSLSPSCLIDTASLPPHLINYLLFVFSTTCDWIVSLLYFLSLLPFLLLHLRGSSRFLIVLLFTFLFVIPAVTAASTFNIFAVNANGLANVSKQAAIASVISSQRPHAWVINETKSSSPLASRIRAGDYTTHESLGVPVGAHSHHGKWGVIVGVRKVLHTKRVTTHDSLQGRAVALDIVIPTTSGHGFTHRLIAIYAPWDPGGSETDNAFWSRIADLCSTAPFSWTVVGDCNATLTLSESSSANLRISAASSQYRTFLNTSHGVDLWSQRDDADASSMYTFHSNNGLSIIDRVAHSSVGILTGLVQTSNVFVPATDHRPITASLALSPPPRFGPTSSTKIPSLLPYTEFPARFLYPKRSEKHRFDTFAETVDRLVRECDLHNIPITDESSFQLRYQSFTEILHSAAQCAFDVPHRHSSGDARRVSNPDIRQVMLELRRIGRLIYATRQHSLQHLAQAHTWVHTYLDDFYSTSNPSSDVPFHTAFLTFLTATRKALHRVRYHLEHLELHRRAVQSGRARINAVLLGGSSKRLYPHAHEISGPPLAITDPQQGDAFITDPQMVKDATTSYFRHLFSRRPRQYPEPDKPWLNTPSVLQIRERTASDPFSWPSPMTLLTLRSTLRKGKPRPAPGPDQWEKWMVKALHDFSLAIVLDLLNYEISTSSIPSCVKPCTLSTIYKCGVPSDLVNYRGVCCNNFLLNTPFAWLNSLLVPYLAKHSVLPYGQVATQPGVQARDLTSFLAHLEAWSNRTSTPVYILRRDQTKGFDHLEPQGFYDAVHAYGLPPSLITFDQSAQTDVPYRVKTAYGLTAPIVISGVTKQGGPLSGLKSTLTTSMGNHWLTDSVHRRTDVVRVTTCHNRLAEHHTPLDSSLLKPVMVEATDDSAILSRSALGLQASCLMMERFQATYGWFTNWVKSLVTILNVLSPPPTLSFPSVLPDRPHSGDVVYHTLPVSTSHFEFLRTSINDPDHQYRRILDIVSSFQLPTLTIRLPITVIRRIFVQCLIARIRPLLSFQPISRTHALDIDHQIAHRVHDYFHFPFHFNSSLLTTPLDQFGFDFPSVSHLNDALAVSGLLRDLNHHVPAFRVMAQITLADWTCLINGCRDPLQDPSADSLFLHQRHHLPFSCILAHSVLADQHISIRDTDQSFLFHNHVSLQHLSRAITPRSSHPLSHYLIRSLSSIGLTSLAQLGQWSLRPDTDASFQANDLVDRVTASSPTVNKYWTLLKTWLTNLPFSRFVSLLTSSNCHSLYIPDFSSWTLALPRPVRQRNAHETLRALALASPHHLTTPSASLLASDASMIPANPSFRCPRMVNFAAVNHTSSLVASLASFRASSTTTHGEIYGMITALITAQPPVGTSPPRDPSLSSPTLTPMLVTDHLNSVRLINDSLEAPLLPHQWSSLPARSLYRWLRDILLHTTHRSPVVHAPAHTTSTSPTSLANRSADTLASASQRFLLPPPPAPLPTFFMDRYTLYSPIDGYIESNIPSYITQAIVYTDCSRAASRPYHTLSLALYDNHCPPDHPYTRASSAFSALVQLYARSAQLDTALARFHRFGNISPRCHFGCDALETAHHVFVICPVFAPHREHARTDTLTETSGILTTAAAPDDLSVQILSSARILFTDHDMWPLYHARYFLGVLPPLPEGETLPRRRLLLRIAHCWHRACIFLAGRIWAEYKRRLHPDRSTTAASTIALPPRLHHLFV
ncbi:hypothetical protein SCP_0115090 [Sparassis crispa]|uniref:Endonuclease/exonuclease/phosphatase domain-containing protein n=1 Tax=Sparassis crispa TaxID=139825 RepID=A0A401G8W7_9APHY|nr:hypothetical protein SCP_0115090 [Sparassis crispa]GBE78620.1 hypothetical protein SCP_0115090 [Sparassis crispa]